MNETDTLKRADIDPRPVPANQPPAAQRLSTSDVVAASNRSTADVARAGDAGPARSENTPLFPPQVAGEFNERWTHVQTAFVDDPRAAVQQADELVAHAIKKLAESFSDERGRLEQQWARGGDASTEDLRVAMQRYRSFFNRLLHL